MAYKLTQADIDKYGFFDAVPGDTPTPEEAAMMAAASNERILTPADIETFQLTGAMAGEPASAADIAKMGGAPAFQLPPEAAAGVSIPQATLSPLRTITVGDNPAMPRADAQPIAQDAMKALGVSDGRQPTYSEARAAGMDPGDAAVASGQATQAGTTAPIVAAPQVAGMPAGPVPASLLQQPYSTDPFEGLSKRQRTILAFAAIADAGAALQGRQGTAFSDTMKGFSDIRDMERKRQIQTAELAARQQMLGALGASPLPPNATPEMIDAHIAKLTGILATTPSMAPYVSAELTRLNAMRDRAATAQGEIASGSRMIDQIDALLYDPALGNALGIEGFFRRPAAELGLDSETARVKARIDQIKGGVFLQAFEALKGGGQITELEGQKAEQAMGRLGTSQSLEDYQEALKELRFYIDIGRRRKMGEQIPPDTVYGGAQGQTEKADPLGIRN
jgi:hypothetical protein